MALIFENLDETNLRICEVDFDRFAILVEPESESESESGPQTTPTAPVPGAPPAPELPELPELAPTHPDDPLAALRESAHNWIGGDWSDDVRAIEPEVIDRPALQPEDRDLLQRASGRPLHSCTLRHMTRGPAETTLDAFLRACRRRGLRYCRVIPGKGIESRATPVLKPLVLRVCRRPDQRDVLAWAPELDTHGEWGSLIIELRSPKQG